MTTTKSRRATNSFVTAYRQYSRQTWRDLIRGAMRGDRDAVVLLALWRRRQAERRQRQQRQPTVLTRRTGTRRQPRRSAASRRSSSNGSSRGDSGDGGPAQPTGSFIVTFFGSASARTKHEELLTLAALRDHVLAASAATKANLPWLKLAAFGAELSEKRSLRHDRNVTAVSGCELDFDRGDLSLEHFVATLRRHCIRGLVYTSPSCTAARPRLRVLLPFSRLLPPEQRAHHAAVVDGIFGGGVFGAESWTLSQSFYFGRALDNREADFRCVVVEGDCIDRRGDLRRFAAVSDQARQRRRPAIKSNGSPRRIPWRQQDISELNAQQRYAVETALAEVGDRLVTLDSECHGGRGVHFELRDLSFLLVARGVPDSIILSVLLDACRSLAARRHEIWDWRSERQKIRRLIIGAHARLARDREQGPTLEPGPPRAPPIRRSMEQARHRLREIYRALLAERGRPDERR